jgi:hypothetical protein
LFIRPILDLRTAADFTAGPRAAALILPQKKRGKEPFPRILTAAAPDANRRSAGR